MKIKLWREQRRAEKKQSEREERFDKSMKYIRNSRYAPQ